MGENRKTVREMLPKAGLKFTTPDRSSFIYVHTDGDSSQMAEDMLSKEGIFVSPGKYFGIPTGYSSRFLSPSRSPVGLFGMVVLKEFLLIGCGKR